MIFKEFKMNAQDILQAEIEAQQAKLESLKAAKAALGVVNDDDDDDKIIFN